MTQNNTNFEEYYFEITLNTIKVVFTVFLTNLLFIKEEIYIELCLYKKEYHCFS